MMGYERAVQFSNPNDLPSQKAQQCSSFMAMILLRLCYSPIQLYSHLSSPPSLSHNTICTKKNMYRPTSSIGLFRIINMTHKFLHLSCGSYLVFIYKGSLGRIMKLFSQKNIDFSFLSVFNVNSSINIIQLYLKNHNNFVKY